MEISTCPHYKKGDRLNNTNYRPVSHLIVVEKVVELVVWEQVVLHFQRKELFHQNHHGSVPKLSIVTALYQIHDMCLQAADNKEMSALVMIDQSSA